MQIKTLNENMMLNCCKVDLSRALFTFKCGNFNKDVTIKDLLVSGVALASLVTIGALLATIANVHHLSTPFSFLNPGGISPSLGVTISGGSISLILVMIIVKNYRRNEENALKVCEKDIDQLPDHQVLERKSSSDSTQDENNSRPVSKRNSIGAENSKDKTLSKNNSQCNSFRDSMGSIVSTSDSSSEGNQRSVYCPDCNVQHILVYCDDCQAYHLDEESERMQTVKKVVSVALVTGLVVLCELANQQKKHK